MGQKINPLSFRLGVTKSWPVRWFIKKNAPLMLAQDETIRRVIYEKIGQAGVAQIEIERTSSRLMVLIKAARPGLVIGRGGKGIEELQRALQIALAKMGPGLRSHFGRPHSIAGATERGVGGGRYPINLTVEELKRSEASAAYLAQQIAWDIEKRLPFRRLMKKHLDQVTQNKEVKGAKIALSGRLDGREIARREWLKKGKLPLQTLRADLDFGRATAFTTYGTVGVKVWIYKGEIFKNNQDQNKKSK